MKTISLKAAMLCAVATTPMMALAQSEPSGFDENGYVEPYFDPMPIEDLNTYESLAGSSYDDPYAEPSGRGRAAASSTANPDRSALPPPGAEVSMSGYDEMLEGLNKDIDARLNQLSVGDSAAKADGSALPNPEVDGYRSTLEQLSADQREIKLLESKLEKAQLAKQVWQELYTDDRDELAAQVADLEAANAELLAAAEEREAELVAQREADQARLMELEFELEMTRAEAEAAVAAAEQAAEAEEIEDEFGEEFEGTNGRPISIPMPENTPRVEAITSVGGRRSARLSLIEGGIRTVGVGTYLGEKHGTVLSIEASSGVKIKLPDGTIKTLERGTFRDVRSTAEFPDIDNEFSYPPDYIDDAASYAN